PRSRRLSRRRVKNPDQFADKPHRTVQHRAPGVGFLGVVSRRASPGSLREFVVRLGTVLLTALIAVGCSHTHTVLRDDTVRTTDTLTDLNYQQVLNNVARFVACPSSVPSIAVVNSGTVTLADQKSIGGSATYNPTLTFAQQGGGA